MKKSLVILCLLVLTTSCKKEDRIDAVKNNLIVEGKALIKQNSSVLLDSVEQFDVRPEKEKNDAPKIIIGLIDSIPKRREELNLGRTDGHTFVSFKLENEDLVNFKSPYKLILVRGKNNDINIVFVTISKLRIERDKAYIVVEKVRGIGMVNEIYYFKKENGIWVFIKKELSKMG